MNAVDWQTLLLLLRKRSGSGLATIGKATGVSWQTLGTLARGETRDPRFSSGVRLLDFAADYLTEADWAQVRAGSAIARG